MVNWNKFIADLEVDPKKFVNAIIENLNPPKYAIDRMRKEFGFICELCWNPSIDVCSYCQRRICEVHSLKMIGPKTKLEWYFCTNCQKTHTPKEIMEKVKQEDEQFYKEDHPP